MTQIYSDLDLLAKAAKDRPGDKAPMLALLDLLIERGDPREKWLRRHIYLWDKLGDLLYKSAFRKRGKCEERRFDRMARRLLYAFQVNF